MSESFDHISNTADIASAYLANNEVASSELPTLIHSIHDALVGLGKSAKGPEVPFPMKETGAVSARKSLANPEKIISMIDGKPYSSLQRHITRHGFTPASYRERFGLKADYPMVAPAYSERRSALSKAFGLGRKTKTPASNEEAPEAKGRGREHKAV